MSLGEANTGGRAPPPGDEEPKAHHLRLEELQNGRLPARLRRGARRPPPEAEAQKGPDGVGAVHLQHARTWAEIQGLGHATPTDQPEPGAGRDPGTRYYN